MRSYAWPLLAALALTINACGSDQTATDAGVDGGGGGRGGSGGRGGGSGRGGTGGGIAGSTGGSATGTAGSTDGGAAGSTGGSTAGSGGGTAGSTGGSTAGSGGATGGSTAGSGGGTGGSTAGSGGRGGTGGGTAGSTGGSTAGSGGRGGTGGGTAGNGGRGGTGGGTAGSTGGSTAGSGGATAGTGGGTAGSTGGSTAGSGGATGGSTGTGGTTGTGGSVACASASTCPGGADDECKHKTCISSFCGIDYTAANTVVTGQTTGDCKRNVCDGAGSVMQAIFDSDPPADDGNVCTSETCVNGIPTHAPEPPRTACAQSGGTLCNGSSSAPACVVCVAATDCPGTDSICHMRVCGNAYTCGFSNAQAGTAAEVDATGNCRKDQCDGLGGKTSVTDDTDTPTDDGNPCTSEVCSSGTPTHPAKPDDTTCSQGAGIVCLGGSCVECRTVADCPGSNTLCRTRTCTTAHACVNNDAPQGTAAGTDATGNCKKPVCDGAGNVISANDDTDKLVDGNVCTADLCTNGTPSNPNLPAGTNCETDGSKTCDGAGVCNPITFRVVRLGAGAGALSSAAASVFVEERKVDGTLVGTPVALPSAPGSSHMLTMSGTATSDGCLSLSGDGHFLALAGYDAMAGTLAVASSASNHVAGRIDIAGTANTSTVFTMANAANNARGATTTDGTEFWVSGPGGSSAGGIWYNTLGAGGTETRVVSNVTNVRCVAIFNNQLYGSSNGTTKSVFSVGFATPTGMDQATTGLPMLSTASPYAFAIFDLDNAVAGVDTVYVADEGVGVEKWKFDGTNWSLADTFNTTGVPAGYRGVAGYAVGKTVTLMASSATSSPNRLVVFVDPNDNSTPAGAIVTTADPNTIFRGVAVSPHFP